MQTEQDFGRSTNAVGYRARRRRPDAPALSGAFEIGARLARRLAYVPRREGCASSELRAALTDPRCSGSFSVSPGPVAGASGN
jgi:hypothetical protein